MIFMSHPFRQIIIHIDHPLTVENMAGWFEAFRYRGRLSEIEQRGKSKPHPAPLVSDQGSTLAAADLAGEHALDNVPFTMVKTQQICPGDEPDVMLMEDSSPLHGSAMQHLTTPAVTELRIHGISAHFVANPATKTRCPEQGNKGRIIEGRICGSEVLAVRTFHLSIFLDATPTILPTP